MEFLDSYKRLDNLCKDLLNSNTGITSYITEMEKNQLSTSTKNNWESDYKQLKHYRYIRNQIVHDNYADEEMLCDVNDIIWLEKFNKRILNQTDPLAQHYKINNQYVQRDKNKSSEKNNILNNKTTSQTIKSETYITKKYVTETKKNKKKYLIKGLVYVIIIAIVCALLQGLIHILFNRL